MGQEVLIMVKQTISISRLFELGFTLCITEPTIWAQHCLHHEDSDMNYSNVEGVSENPLYYLPIQWA